MVTTNQIQFAHDMEDAGYEVRDYGGRNFYQGPAVVLDKSALQFIIRSTDLTLQWDDMGKSDYVVYPIG